MGASNGVKTYRNDAVDPPQVASASVFFVDSSGCYFTPRQKRPFRIQEPVEVLEVTICIQG
jgi:hypothetical protein